MDKATDDNYILALMAIAKELNIAGIRTADAHLAAGLPMTWICRRRETFCAYLLRSTKTSRSASTAMNTTAASSGQSVSVGLTTVI